MLIEKKHILIFYYSKVVKEEFMFRFLRMKSNTN